METSTHRESLGCILLNGVTGDAGATTRGIAYSPNQAERREQVTNGGSVSMRRGLTP
jgi:hypothetical protein